MSWATRMLMKVKLPKWTVPLLEHHQSVCTELLPVSTVLNNLFCLLLRHPEDSGRPVEGICSAALGRLPNSCDLDACGAAGQTQCGRRCLVAPMCPSTEIGKSIHFYTAGGNVWPFPHSKLTESSSTTLLQILLLSAVVLLSINF